ncbi:hypothetical protein ACFX15_011724 [Malus domestica]
MKIAIQPSQHSDNDRFSGDFSTYGSIQRHRFGSNDRSRRSFSIEHCTISLVFLISRCRLPIFSSIVVPGEEANYAFRSAGFQSFSWPEHERIQQVRSLTTQLDLAVRGIAKSDFKPMETDIGLQLDADGFEGPIIFKTSHEDTGGSTISKLRRALEEYLSVLIGLTKKEYGLERLVEFKWKCLEDGKQVNGP